MRRLVLPILAAALSTGCAILPWSDDDTGLVCQRGVGPGDPVREGDPRAPGEPLAEVDVTAMTPAQAGEAAVAAGLAATWRYTYKVGPPLEEGWQGYSECWCVPPPGGRVSDVAYDSTGGLILFVDSGQTLAASRPQPRLGWGCEGSGPAPVG